MQSDSVSLYRRRICTSQSIHSTYSGFSSPSTPSGRSTFSVSPLTTEYSGPGDRLGEEEWTFSEEQPELTTRKSVFGATSSRITFVFAAHRHSWYYVLRIFLPLLIIVSVSWFSLFLQKFSKQVDISAGNLLVYVALNFTISRELPRLGYMTLMDVIPAASFVITSLAVVWNVLLRRLEPTGRGRTARMINAYTLWVCPGACALVVYLAFRHYFPGETGKGLFTLAFP